MTRLAYPIYDDYKTKRFTDNVVLIKRSADVLFIVQNYDTQYLTRYFVPVGGLQFKFIKHIYKCL